MPAVRVEPKLVTRSKFVAAAPARGAYLATVNPSSPGTGLGLVAGDAGDDHGGRGDYWGSRSEWRGQIRRAMDLSLPAALVRRVGATRRRQLRVRGARVCRCHRHCPRCRMC